MLSRERVIQVIKHQKPDRVPLYGWLTNDEFEKKVVQAFGSVDNFEDKYEFDLVHVFPRFGPFRYKEIDNVRKEVGVIEPGQLLSIPLTDPNDSSLYKSIVDDVKLNKEKKGRFLYIQTPGYFEAYNSPFGIENHLMYLALYPEELHELYNRLAQWNVAFAGNCLDIGIDMIHVSDDWGAQRGLLFNPAIWKELLYPYHKVVCDAVKARGGFVSLHSDGNINQVFEDVIELGYDVVHPFQESAGMNVYDFKEKYRGSISIMGGLDVQETIGFGKLDHLRNEIMRIIDLFRDGGLIYCTSHMIQPHCSIEELVFAYDFIFEYIR